MAWSWTYECDFQLFLMTPFLVILYKKIGRVPSYFLFTAPIFLGVYINYQSSYAYDLTAGIFSLENFYMFSYYINKPWYKLGVYFVGLLSAMIFIDVREYKKSIREGTVDKLQYTTVNFLHRSDSRVNGGCCKRIIPMVSLLSALVGYFFICFIAFPRQIDPYGWTDAQNAWFYAVTRTGWAICTMTLFFFLVLDHAPLVRHAFANPNTHLLGQLIWPCYIIAPLVYMNMYCTTQSAIFMTMINNIYLGMGAMWITIFFAFSFIFLFSNPVETVMDLTLRRLVTSKALSNPQVNQMKQSIK